MEMLFSFQFDDNTYQNTESEVRSVANTQSISTHKCVIWKRYLFMSTITGV